MYRCTVCSFTDLPFDAMQVIQDRTALTGVCLGCYERELAAGTTLGVSLLKQYEAQHAAAGGVQLYRCVQCGSQCKGEEMRLEFGESVTHQPYRSGFCVYCLSDEQLTWLHQRSSLPRPPAPTYSRLLAG